MNGFREHILDLCRKKEGYTIEFKGAKGGLPHSLWESYSAFANTAGGIIVLGVNDKNDTFTPDGLDQTAIRKYKKNFWDSAHNTNKVSICLLKEEDVIEDQFEDGSYYLIFRIPRAPFDAKPVYIDGNPRNTYRRNHEGDYLCTQSEISRMYAEADILAHSLDSAIYKHLSLERDFDKATIDQYRQLYRLHHEGHVWNDISDLEFFKKMGAYTVDAETGEEGFTLAALLMFGTGEAIQSVLPHYFVDYREKLSSDPRIRYTHRIYPDGTWEPNIFQFFKRVNRELAQALPVPFKLDGIDRVDETPAHESLREAICNTLIHAQYRMPEGIVIERYPDKLYFSNPGTMLIPVESFFEGGHSICRNAILQKLFIAIGRGEHMGSGADVIEKGWKENGWPDPELKEHYGANDDRVELVLRIGARGAHDVTDNVTVDLTERQRIILSILSFDVTDDVTETTTSLAQKTGVSRRTIVRDLGVMKEKGYVTHVGPDNGGYWKRLK